MSDNLKLSTEISMSRELGVEALFRGACLLFNERPPFEPNSMVVAAMRAAFLDYDWQSVVKEVKFYRDPTRM